MKNIVNHPAIICWVIFFELYFNESKFRIQSREIKYFSMFLLNNTRMITILKRNFPGASICGNLSAKSRIVDYCRYN